jgi:hypothetical protein
MRALALTLAGALLALGCSDPANTQYLPIGSACSADTQCGTPSFACASNYRGGYCQKPCSSNSDCPSDALCLPSLKQCRRSCASAADCRASEGYACVPLSHGAVCDEVVMDGGQPSG